MDSDSPPVTAVTDDGEVIEELAEQSETVLESNMDPVSQETDPEPTQVPEQNIEIDDVINNNDGYPENADVLENADGDTDHAHETCMSTEIGDVTDMAATNNVIDTETCNGTSDITIDSAGLAASVDVTPPVCEQHMPDTLPSGQPDSNEITHNADIDVVSGASVSVSAITPEFDTTVAPSLDTDAVTPQEDTPISVLRGDMEATPSADASVTVTTPDMDAREAIDDIKQALSMGLSSDTTNNTDAGFAVSLGGSLPESQNMDGDQSTEFKHFVREESDGGTSAITIEGSSKQSTEFETTEDGERKVVTMSKTKHVKITRERTGNIVTVGEGTPAEPHAFEFIHPSVTEPGIQAEAAQDSQMGPPGMSVQAEVPDIQVNMDEQIQLPSAFVGFAADADSSIKLPRATHEHSSGGIHGEGGISLPTIAAEGSVETPDMDTLKLESNDSIKGSSDDEKKRSIFGFKLPSFGKKKKKKVPTATLR